MKAGGRSCGVGLLERQCDRPWSSASQAKRAFLLSFCALFVVVAPFLLYHGEDFLFSATTTKTEDPLAREAARMWLISPSERAASLGARAGATIGERFRVPWFFRLDTDQGKWAPAKKTSRATTAAAAVTDDDGGPTVVCLWGTANQRQTSIFRPIGVNVAPPIVSYGSGAFRYVFADDASQCAAAAATSATGGARSRSHHHVEVMMVQYEMVYRNEPGRHAWQMSVTQAQRAALRAGIPFFAIGLGDELCEHTGSDDEHSRLLYRQYWDASMLRARYATYLPLGIRTGFRIPNADNVRQARGRDIAFNFVGSLTSASRLTLAAVVDQRRLVETFGGVFNLTSTWSAEKSVLEPRAYLRLLATSKFTLCPAGHSPETYRLFEAAAAGSIPVIVADEADGMQQQQQNQPRCRGAFEPLVRTDAPVVILRTWADLPDMLEHAKRHPLWVNRLQARTRPWFDGFMRDFATEWESTLTAAQKANAAAVALQQQQHKNVGAQSSGQDVIVGAKLESYEKEEEKEAEDEAKEEEEEEAEEYMIEPSGGAHPGPGPDWTEPGHVDYDVVVQVVTSDVAALAYIPPLPTPAVPSKPPGTIPLVTGCGRSGSLTAAQYLPLVGVPAEHEGVTAGAVSVSWLYAGTLPGDSAYPFEKKHQSAARLAATNKLVGGQNAFKGAPFGPVVHLVRHPLEVINSIRSCFCGSGVLLTSRSIRANQRSWDHVCTILPYIPDICDRDVLPDDSMRKAALYWLNWNTLVTRRYPHAPVVRLEGDNSPARLLAGLGESVTAVQGQKGAKAQSGQAKRYSLKARNGTHIALPPNFPRLGHISESTEGYKAHQRLTWANLRLLLGSDMVNRIASQAAVYGYTNVPSPTAGTKLGHLLLQQARPHITYPKASPSEPVVIGGLALDDKGGGGSFMMGLLRALGIRMIGQTPSVDKKGPADHHISRGVGGGGDGGGGSGGSATATLSEAGEWSLPLELCNREGLGTTLDGVCTLHQIKCCAPGWPYGGAWWEDRITPLAANAHDAFTVVDKRGSKPVAAANSRCANEASADAVEGCGREGLLGLAGRALEKMEAMVQGRGGGGGGGGGGNEDSSTKQEQFSWGFVMGGGMGTLPLLQAVRPGAFRFIQVVRDGRSQTPRHSIMSAEWGAAGTCAEFYSRLIAMDGRHRAARIATCKLAAEKQKQQRQVISGEDLVATLRTELRLWSDMHGSALDFWLEHLGLARGLALRLEDLADPQTVGEASMRLVRFLGLAPKASAEEMDLVQRAIGYARKHADAVNTTNKKAMTKSVQSALATALELEGGVGDRRTGGSLDAFVRFGYANGAAGSRAKPPFELDTILQ